MDTGPGVRVLTCQNDHISKATERVEVTVSLGDKTEEISLYQYLGLLPNHSFINSLVPSLHKLP